MDKRKAVFIDHPVQTNAEAFVEECRHDSTESDSEPGARRPMRNTVSLAPKTCCLDYLKMCIKINLFDENSDSTFFGKNMLSELLRILKVDPLNYDDRSDNKPSYDQSRQYDEDIWISGGFKGDDHHSFVEMKGHALRLFEVRGGDYRELFSFFVENGWYSEEVDFPLDDYSGSITPRELEYKVRNHYYQSRLVRHDAKVDYDVSSKASEREITLDTRCHGWSLTIGGRTSRQLCIYDKRAERLYRGFDCTAEHWMRYESRFFNETAQSVFLSIYKALNEDAMPELCSSLIRGLIEFKSNNACHLVGSRHTRRANIWSKWKELVADSPSFKFVKQGQIEQTITHRKKWMDRSVTNTINKLLSVYGTEGLLEIISKSCASGKHLNSVSTNKNLAEINNQRKALGLDPIGLDAIKDNAYDFYRTINGSDPVPDDAEEGRTSDHKKVE